MELFANRLGHECDDESNKCKYRGVDIRSLMKLGLPWNNQECQVRKDRLTEEKDLISSLILLLIFWELIVGWGIRIQNVYFAAQDIILLG